MADISAAFGILLFLGLAFPGLLTANYLLFPATVERARLRLDRTPWKCFFVGGLLTAVLAIPTVILFVVPNGAVQFAGWALVAVALTFATLGATGLASKMGERLGARSGNTLSPIASFVRGALALELAAAFPVIGWFIFIPLAVVTSLGASAFAVLRWVPAARAVTQALGENAAQA
jgi:hypothetical protein